MLFIPNSLVVHENKIEWKSCKITEKARNLRADNFSLFHFRFCYLFKEAIIYQPIFSLQILT